MTDKTGGPWGESVELDLAVAKIAANLAIAIEDDICNDVMKESKMSEWKPIDTAPKDGSDILIGKVGLDYVFMAHWEMEPGWAWKSGTPCWAVYMADDDFYSIYRESDWPTHWMPLPGPPKQ